MTSLDPVLSGLLTELNERAVDPGPDPDADDLRAGFDDLLAFLRTGPARPFAGEVRDEVVETDAGPVLTRTHRPSHVADDGAVVVFLHGGGWVLGDLDSAAPTARAMAEEAGLVTVSVDYRTAPEHPFPAAFEDALAVVRHHASLPGRTWLAVAGDSAGGNLAAAVALACAADGVRLDAQLLIYPALDPARDSASYAAFADGYLLTRGAMDYYWRSYAGGAPDHDPRLAPAHADDLRGVPPAIVTTAGFDPLHDEGQAYAARLVAADVATTYLPSPDLIHGWLELTDRVPAARAARSRAVAALATLHAEAGRA